MIRWRFSLLAAERRSRIRLPLMLPIAILVVLAASGVVLVEESTFRSQAGRERQSRADASLTHALSELGVTRRSHETYARLLADTPGLQRAVAARDAKVARRLLVGVMNNQAFDEITIYGADASEVLHLGPPKSDRIDAALFGSAIRGATRSSSVIDPTGLIVLASTPIPGTEPVGVVVVGTTLNGPELTLLRSQKEAQIALYQADSLVGTSAGGTALVATLHQARLGTAGIDDLNAQLSGFDLYSSKRQLEGGELVVMASGADLAAFARQRALVIVGAAALLLIALAIMSAFVRRTVTRPLQALVAITNLMRAGDYSGRAASSRIPELDALATGVNHLAEQVEGSVRIAEQLRQSQKMDAIGRLAGGIAHDFNNLLTAIGGQGELLLLELGEGTPERESAEQIVGAATRAAGLTRQLLTFSRQQVVEPKVLELNEVVDNAEKLLRSIIGENVELVRITEPLVRRVRVDRNQLDQVILNLAVNARDAMPNGGTLTIETRHAAPDDGRLYKAGIPAGAYSVLVISDTGVGMDETTRLRIFEPFFTTKDTGKGTGLGLATVHGIVEQSGGHVAIRSRLGHGTSFEIYLPTVSDPVERLESVETPMGHLGAETLLLVEDEEVVRRLVRAVLERTGYEVLVAADVRDAIHICEEHEGRIDLMVTDVAMPDLNGCELAAIVTELRPTMKVLYMSGYLDDAVVQLGVGDGVPFLQKPFTHDALVRKVWEVLDSQKDTGESEPVAALG